MDQVDDVRQRKAKIGGQFIQDLAGVRIAGSVKNVADRTYVASRRPEGIKVGLPRHATVGLSWEF